MDAVVTFLTEAGPVGMFVAAFLAGSILPFSSEAVMVGLLAAGASPTALLVWGTAGNALGGWANYGIGRLGRPEWMSRVAHVGPEQLERGLRPVRRWGAWAGLLSAVPIVGDLITVALGYVRVSPALALPSIALGKYVRYQLIVSTWAAAATHI